MLYKWKNVVLQMLLMRLCPSLTADQTRYLLPLPFFVLVSQAIFMWDSPLPLPPTPPPPPPPHTHTRTQIWIMMDNNKDWVLLPRPFIIYYV